METAKLSIDPSAIVTFNIDTYEDRLRILDMLAASYPVPTGFLDPMQGDRIQTQWQLDSGRSNNPWWNKINFTLTVWRMQALQTRGEFPNVALQGTMQVPLPEDVRQNLFTYYNGVRAIQSVTETAEAHLQTLFWLVHDHTVAAATAAAVDQVSTLAPGEREFALGWGKVMVKVLADVDFSTDRHFVGPLNRDCLPQRICQAADIDPIMPSDLPPPQRTTVLMISSLFLASGLSPIYTPVLEVGAAALDGGIEAGLDLKRDLSNLKNHLRRYAVRAVGI